MNGSDYTGGTTNVAKDPRCPVCGNAVLGAFVQGNEGRYHRECTQAPASVRVPAPVFIPVPTPPVIVVDPPRPDWDRPFPTWPQITCDTTPFDVHDDCCSSILGSAGVPLSHVTVAGITRRW